MKKYLQWLLRTSASMIRSTFRPLRSWKSVRWWKAEGRPQKQWTTLKKKKRVGCIDSSPLKISKGTGTNQGGPYTPLVDEGGLRPFSFAHHGRLYYPNLCRGEEVNWLLIKAAKLDWPTSKGIVPGPGRGDHEWTHRWVKESGTEKLPGQDFQPNTAFY